MTAILWPSWRAEVPGEPLCCQRGDLFEGTGFLKQVRRVRHNLQMRLAVQLGEGLSVQLQDLEVIPADDKKCRAAHLGEGRTGQIRPTTTGNPRPRLTAGERRHSVPRRRRCLLRNSR